MKKKDKPIPVDGVSLLLFFLLVLAWIIATRRNFADCIEAGGTFYRNACVIAPTEGKE